MRTTTIIILVLFILASSLITIFTINLFSSAAESQVSKQSSTISSTTTIQQESEKTTEIETTTSATIQPSSAIEKIEVYMDGTKEGGGIFLGEAEYGIDSPQTVAIYGEKFSNSGFSLSVNSTGYDFQPGSIHSFYIYAYIPKSGWEYVRKTITIPGEHIQPQNIKFFIDTPANGSVIDSDVNIGGWAVNLNVPDSPGISYIEFYLNGPKGFGKKIGDASLGSLREDVASSLGNPAYTNSGFNFVLPVNIFEPGTYNLVYCYAVSVTGESYENILELKIQGTQKEEKAIISIEDNIVSDIQHGLINIKGWAISKDFFKENIETIKTKQYSIKKIVFTSTVNGNEDIFSINIDGSGLTQLTDNPSNDMYPQISPDGKKILYTADINGTWQIMTMNTDGSEKKQLTNGTYRSGFPAMTFEGRYIFYEVYIENNWEIFRMDSNGTNQVRITFSPAIDDWHPFAHPFEFKIIYESGAVGTEDIYYMDYDGSNIRKISDLQIRKRVPCISKDGKYIAFAGLEQDYSSIFIMNSDGSNPVRLTNNNAYDVHPTISPDNQFIAFDSNMSGNNEIYIMNFDGSNQTKITDIPGDDWGAVFLYQE